MKVVAAKNLPAKLPLGATVLWPTALAFWGAPQWLWGIGLFVLAVIWVIVVWALVVSEPVDLFEGKR